MRYIRRIGGIVCDNYKRLFVYRNLSVAFSVQSHLTINERIALYELSKKTNIVAEIGSYIGASACCYGEAAKENKKTIICIDTWNNDAMTEGTRDTWSQFRDNVSNFSDYIITVRGLSTDVIENVRMITLTIDLLFIDGDHSYEGVKADWDSYKEFLRPGSTVIFHDYGWADGVKRVVHEDVMPLAARYDQLPNMWWCTLAKQP